MVDATQLAFIAGCRTATLVTMSVRGDPRPVPICFVLGEQHPHADAAVLYSPLDEKPKRSADVRALARVRDIIERPSVTLLFDRWSEDWSELAWLRARGRARLIDPGAEGDVHARAVTALRARYPQYRAQHIERAPLIRIAIDDTIWWSAGPDLR